MCPPSKISDQVVQVKITGSIGSVGGDIVGRDKITYGLDEEKVVAAVLRAFQKMEQGNSALISRKSPSLPRRTTLLVPQDSLGLKHGLIPQLRESLGEIVSLISDLDDDRDIDLANNRLSAWKRKTDKIVNSAFDNGNLDYEIRLYNIMADANQRTPFNKIKNESRKCQKIITDILRELDGG